MKQVSAPVIAISEVMPGVHLIWLRCPEIAVEATPGQFVMVSCGEECTLPRPFSLHQVNDKGIALLFQVVGKGTDWLSQRQAGDNVDMFGPLGNGFTLQPKAKNILMIAGGVGIAPLRFLADKALEQSREVTLLYGTADSKRLSTPPQIKLVSATEDGTIGHRGKVTDLLPQYIDWADQIFACGPPPMYRTMALMPELKDKPVQISLEVRMACGLGVCYGCTVRTKTGLKQVCKDGPVFELDDIIWDELNFL